MLMAEKIHQSVQKLPVSLQAEVLDFVEYLLSKEKRGVVYSEGTSWSDISLGLALRDMPDNAEILYSTEDLKVLF